MCLDAYEAMTARIGKRGRKRKETRLHSAWIEQRLDGREYSYVKLYGGVPGFYEWAPWTLFVCEGYQALGGPGFQYEVENYGEGLFKCIYTGMVWEVSLGVVVDRHLSHGSNGKNYKPRLLHDQEFKSALEAMGQRVMGVVESQGEETRKSVQAIKQKLPSTSGPAPSVVTGGLTFADHKDAMKAQYTHSEAMMDKFTSCISSFAPHNQTAQQSPAPPVVDQAKIAKGLQLLKQMFGEML